MTDTVPAIELRNISKAYGALRVIDDVSLTVDKGVFITLLGPSGCGKSTLLRSIVGLAQPDSGEILVDGKDITRAVAHNRPVKMVFQDYALFPHMTVTQNIGFGCEMQGMGRKAIADRCQELLDLIRLPDLGNRYPDALSGGQRQRVALARALAPDPSALLLDEPLGALDLKLRQDMQRELKSIQRRTEKTFVFVTHDQEEAMSMSDLVAVMNKGRIEQLDTPQNVYANPVSEFVASFVGAANLFPASVTAVEGGEIRLETAGTEWTIPANRVTSPHALKPGDSATVVIRPEALSAQAEHNGHHIRLCGKVTEQTYFGDRVHLHLELAGDQSVLIDARPGTLEAASGEMTVTCRTEDVAVIARKD
ncbi:ABC transporter ATP-binding protein [Cucumibacter marinus]|uniref:ABC transporter ATP-binding protein n=1 Tax=Cucumibacter marinus TaxID=1121252 RepID=UPI0003FFF7AD|nr:ABC transporter ATP-binding protein [Cucumibacter marinus]